jgi:Fe-S cluster assembly protein SufD
MLYPNLNSPIIDVSQDKAIALSLKGANTYFLIDYSKTDIEKKINIILDSKKTTTIFLYVLCNAKHKNYQITCNHKQNSHCNINVKTLVTNQGFVKFDISNSVDKNILNCKINQDIQGLTFDNDSKITVTPAILANANKIIANHSVNIGNVNPEVLFYLQSRGLTKSQATIKLIQGMFENINIESSKLHLNAYNSIIQHVHKLFKINYEKY